MHLHKTAMYDMQDLTYTTRHFKAAAKSSVFDLPMGSSLLINICMVA